MSRDTTKIKQALKPLFGWSNIKVRRGKGTAYGWIHIDIDISDSEYVEGVEFSKEGELYTTQERELISNLKAKVEKIAHKVADIGYYYRDSGYPMDKASQLLVNFKV